MAFPDMYSHLLLTALLLAVLLQLTCFILPNKYGHLLQPKTIWNAEETPEHSLLEQILHLEPLEVSIMYDSIYDVLSIMQQMDLRLAVESYCSHLKTNLVLLTHHIL